MKEYIEPEIQLLSAQKKTLLGCEELIRCKDCDRYNHQLWMCNIDCRTMEKNDYCSLAEKKNDND